jgi:hypothetical protein
MTQSKKTYEICIEILNDTVSKEENFAMNVTDT